MLTSAQRQSLVLSSIPVAQNLAKQKLFRTHKKVTLDELVSAAYLGLVKYVNKYGNTHDFIDNQDFKPHLRINGEMKDYLRSLGWGPKGRLSACSIDYAECKAA